MHPRTLRTFFLLLMGLAFVACNVGNYATPGSGNGGNNDDGSESSPTPTDPLRETSCADGIDNDGDFYTDCQDSDCAVDPACGGNGRETNCSDGIDEDGDGATDCQDSDCNADPACGGASWGNSMTGTLELVGNWNTDGQACFGLPATSTERWNMNGSAPALDRCVGLQGIDCYQDWTVNWTSVQSEVWNDALPNTWRSVGVAPGPDTPLLTVFFDDSDPANGPWFILTEDTGGSGGWSGQTDWFDYVDQDPTSPCFSLTMGQFQFRGNYSSF